MDVWWIDLRHPVHDAGALSPGEVAAASDRMTVRARHSYIAAHAAVRRILSEYTGRDPAALKLRRTELGKPELVPAEGWHFSLSRTADFAVSAVSRDGPVGIDCEAVTPRAAIADLLDYACSPEETADMHGVEGAERIAAFFRIWTRKEAVAKALGLGLHLPFDTFTVWRRDGVPRPMVEIHGARIFLSDLHAPDGHMGALASTEPIGAPHILHYDPRSPGDADTASAGSPVR